MDGRVSESCVDCQRRVSTALYGVSCVVCCVDCPVWSVMCRVLGVDCPVWSVTCRVLGVDCPVWSVVCRASCVCRVSSVDYRVCVDCPVWSDECRIMLSDDPGHVRHPTHNSKHVEVFSFSSLFTQASRQVSQAYRRS
jgi:hypothetical protein